MRSAFRIFILSMLLACPALAQVGFFSDVHTRVLGVYTDYSGEKYKGFAANSTATGFEIQSVAGNSSFELVGGVGMLVYSGTEDIMDGTTARNLDLSGYLINIDVGFHMSLVPSSKLKLRPYIGALGAVQMLSLKLPDNITYTNLSASETDTLTGYYAVAGIEYTPGRGTGSNTGYTIELRSQNIGGKVLGTTSFQLQGLSFVLGMKF